MAEELTPLTAVARWNGEDYRKFRPTYPDSLYESVLVFAGQERHHASSSQQRGGLAVDLGCGNGQATSALAPHFDRVIGLDPSEEQLRNADRSQANVEYRLGSCGATGLPPHSVDLLTAASALHWFDLPALWREARRILKPGGAFAAWSYSGMTVGSSGDAARQERFVPDNPRAVALRSALFKEFSPFLHPRLLNFLEHGYAEYLPSSDEFAEARLDRTEMSLQATVEQMCGWAKSWSSYPPYCEHHGEERAERVLQQFERDMLRVLAVPDVHTPVEIIWPVDMVLARQPLPLASQTRA